MVKVTIEKNGKVVNKLEGELIAAAEGNDCGNQYRVKTAIYGRTSTEEIKCFVAQMATGMVSSAINDPSMVMSVLAAAIDDIKAFMTDYGKEHAEEIVKNMIDEL